MNNRRVLYIFVSLVLIVCTVLLSSVLFSVKETAVEARGERGLLNLSAVSDKLNGIKGKNIFFIDEAELERQIHLADPYAAVINVERVFPSKVIVHIYQRTEAYSVKLGNGAYAVIDAQGVVVALSADNYGAIYMTDAYAEEQKLQNTALQIDFSAVPAINSRVTGMEVETALAFYRAAQQLRFDEHTFRALFCEVKPISGFDSALSRTAVRLEIKMHCGAILDISDASLNTVQKLSAAYSALSNMPQSQRSGAKLYVFQSSDGEIWVDVPD